jgi:hypothetical protein
LQAQGDTAALRQLDLAGIDASNRSIQQQIYDLEDLKAATDAAAKAASDAAAAQQRIADEQANLEQQLLQAQGNTAAIRAAQLDKLLSDSARATQVQIWALQDQTAATQAAAQAAQDAAQKEQQLADQRAGLQGQLWQLQGNTAAIRAAELAKITDPLSRALQQAIYAAQDQQAAAEAAQQAADQAAQQADQAAQAAEQLRDAWKSVADSILDEVQRIRGTMLNGPQSYASLLSQFDAATALARTGDQDAAKSLPELSKNLLDAAEQAATSQQELMRIQGTTASSLEQTYAMINALSGNSPAPAAISFGSTTLTAHADWVAAFQASAEVVARASNDNAGASAESNSAIDALRRELAETRAELFNALTQIAAPLVKAADILSRAEKQGQGDGLAVSTKERAA